MSLDVLPFERVRWGITACAVPGCGADAEGWVDVFGPICLGCFERYLDYREAQTIAGGALPYAFFVHDDGAGVMPTGL